MVGIPTRGPFAVGLNDYTTVDVPETIRCDQCDSESPIVMIADRDFAGEPVHWPKSTVRGDSLFIFIKCPKCGEREQCIAPTGDAF